MLLDASYALQIAQETIRLTLLQNEKMRRERLLFGVKPSGRIFFSYIYQRVRVISIFEEAHESMRERNQISTRWFRGYGYILSPTVSVQIIHITTLAPLKLFYLSLIHI